MSGHNKVEIDLSKPYQANDIGVKGIIYFAIGLFLLIVVTFTLMWVFQYHFLEIQAQQEDEKARDPLALTKAERLPPEPRLQSAPGFGVDSMNGRIDLELREPQAEYKVLHKQWEDLWENGEKDTKSGTVVALSMKEAKEKVMTDGSLKAVSAEEGEAALNDASMIISSSSAGRLKSERKR